MEQTKAQDSWDLILMGEDLVVTGEVEELVVHLEVETGVEIWDLEVIVECLVEDLVL